MHNHVNAKENHRHALGSAPDAPSSVLWTEGSSSVNTAVWSLVSFHDLLMNALLLSLGTHEKANVHVQVVKKTCVTQVLFMMRQ